MVYIYTCQACEQGDHVNCEIGAPMSEGAVSGGSRCRCGCNGDPNWLQKVANMPMIDFLKWHRLSDKVNKND